MLSEKQVNYKIVRALIGELKYGEKKEREDASLFLKGILLSRDETLSHKVLAAWHLSIDRLDKFYVDQSILIRRGYYTDLIRKGLAEVKRALSRYFRGLIRDFMWDEAFSDSLSRNMTAVVVVMFLFIQVGDFSIKPEMLFSGGKECVSYMTPDSDEDSLIALVEGGALDEMFTESKKENEISALMEKGRCYTRRIKVTGYYSPIPGQDRYATGSYKGDIRLNGRGIMAADTTPVYLGMAAGPPFMDFGTKLVIRDLGDFDMPELYTVHDRGGAIRGNHIDIWMGEGEEAMRKAYEISGYYDVIVVETK